MNILPFPASFTLISRCMASALAINPAPTGPDMAPSKVAFPKPGRRMNLYLAAANNIIRRGAMEITAVKIAALRPGGRTGSRSPARKTRRTTTP